MLSYKVLFGLGLLCAPALAQQVPNATRLDHVQTGVVSSNDGSFNYQGYLEVDGQPANGMYSFRFEAFNNPTGPDIASELSFVSPTIPVVDGLFMVNVQMGGTPADAREFWRTIGDQEMYFEIGVSEIEGGPYTTLGTRSPLGWSARAQYAGISESLRFPYSETYTNEFGDPATMLSLTSEFGGVVAEFSSLEVRDEPIVHIHGKNVFNSSFGFQSGALLVDSRDDEVGIRAEGSRYSVVGFFSEPSTLPGVSAAVLGSVSAFSSPDVIAVWAINSASGTSASLGTENYAGEFSGDVLVNGDIRVERRPERDFGVNQFAPIGPVAYGSISSSGTVTSGTANLTASWDLPNQRYVISVMNELFDFATTSVHVTVVDAAEPRVATFNTIGTNIIVKIWDINSGNIAVQDNFSIVIYKPNPTSFVQRGAPPGVDADKYYEQTGTSPVIASPPRAEPALQPQPNPIGSSN